MAKKESTSTANSKLKPIHTDKQTDVPGQYSLQIPRGLGPSKSLPAIVDRFTDDEVKDVIHKCYGIRTSMCAMLDCSYN